MYDLIIIGAGPAGLTAALYALRSGKSVLVLEGEAFGGQITLSPAIENYPGTGTLSGADFANTLMNQVMSLGGETEFATVTEITDGDVKTVITEDERYFARAVIIASGVKHKRLGFESENRLVGRGISYCAICDGAFYKDKAVAVVGGGSSAATSALYLSEICKTVFLIHRRQNLRAETALTEKLQAKENIKLILDSTVTDVFGDEKLERIEITSSGGAICRLDLDALFISIGQQPENGIFEKLADTDEDGFILTDSECRTKTPGIFATGDCRKKSIRQLTTAVSDGTYAAVSACDYINGL